VRAFVDSNVTHVAGEVDPVRDCEIIELELVMADAEVLTKHLERMRLKLKSGKTKDLEKELGALERIAKALDQGQPARTVELDEEECVFVKQAQLLTMKPVLYVLNVGEGESVPASLKDHEALPISVKLESEIMQMAPEDQKTFLKELGVEQSGLDRLILKAYELLGLITYFTSGEKETRAWTVAGGTAAPQAAGVIHTDFIKGFIKADVCSWEDFIQFKGWSGIKDTGKLRLEGKEYEVRDGDVVYFHIVT